MMAECSFSAAQQGLAAAIHTKSGDIESHGATLPTLDTTTSPSESTDKHTAEGEGGIGSARTPWYGTAFLLLAEIMGMGILSLPFAAAKLGWVAALMAVPVFGLISVYSGWLLARVKQEYPAFRSYADASTELLGPCFGKFTKICMLLSWGALAIYFLIATGNGIAAVYDKGWFACSRNRTIIAALLLILPTQCRDFHTITKWLSLPSTAAVVISILIILVGLATQDSNGSFGTSTTVGPPPGTTPTSFLEALSSFVFAYQGQSIFLELMTEMKDYKQFPRSVNLASAAMCCMYGLTVVVAYGLEGDKTPGFLPNALQSGPSKTVVGVLLVFHTLVAYVITSQPLHVWIHSTVFPETLYQDSPRGIFHWLIVTVGFILFGWIVGNLIPFFADVQALIGSLFGAPIMFLWPPLLYFCTIRNQIGGKDGETASWKETFRSIGWGHVMVCLILLCVMTPLFCILGTVGGFQSIITDAAKAGIPFHCS